MKKSFLISAMFFIMCTPALAYNVEVEALSDFSTNDPPQTFSVKVVEPVNSTNVTIESGSIIKGKVITKDAKRLKQDATFSFINSFIDHIETEVE